jgi:hypothetical protein
MPYLHRRRHIERVKHASDRVHQPAPRAERSGAAATVRYLLPPHRHDSTSALDALPRRDHTIAMLAQLFRDSRASHRAFWNSGGVIALAGRDAEVPNRSSNMN